MKNKQMLVLLIAVASSVRCGAQIPRSFMQEPQKDSNGVTLRTAVGAMRIEVCGDRVVHVIASPTSEIPLPTVPVVTHPCKARSLRVEVRKSEVRLYAEALTVKVDGATGQVSFFS